MGWTSYHASYYKNGKIDRKAEMDDRWSQSEHDGYAELTVLKSTMVGSVYYAAIRRRKTNEEDKVFAVVCLTSVDKKDYYNFSYKDMDETCGPYECKCPMSILNLLTPTDSEWANNWRKKCREYNANKKEKNWLQELPIGGKIVFTRPDGRKQNLIKHEPAYQFKTWFWFDPDYHQYVSKKYVTINNAELVTE